MATKETNGGVMDVVLEFTGGLESLTSSKRTHKVSIPSSLEGRPTDVAGLVRWVAREIMGGDRGEMFIQGEGVRPGILVLINDADWELDGGESYLVQPGDNFLFVSTLHGG
ncbi:Ubiquitin- modifier 1 [Pseudogymnoascus destructans]|uniref:Ubiquitin-related modifier 1 n=2 Tax=Pseudogymnoascus destructans TaxID=655981 RepID=L8FMM7_PSED2|nr:Ubiquitin- modifier 1 [Pseudogymnoascus destructans]ELR02200.1 hypothetical protein GMDG_00993 [Pseudogymnoascus destructans 20631-21]OAF55829.1 Ubiquitin- modifier 1 [Pseudogymnoascus destructans]